MENKELMQQQRKRYMNGDLSHEQYYLWLAGFIGANKTHLPVSLDRIRQSRDEHLNDIQLGLWDRRDPMLRSLAYAKRLPWSLSDTVCVLKAIARRESTSPQGIREG